MSLLVVDHLSHRFGNLRAVDDVSLTVEVGELRALIGPNGAGKTTVFNLISGFFPPTSGRIVFDSRDVTALAPHRRVAMGMARTFQITEVFPELSVRDNVRIPVELQAGKRLSPWLSRGTRKALDEQAHVIGLSVLSGSHLPLVEDVVGRMKEAGLDVPVVVGGIIPPEDAVELEKVGVAAVYTPKDFELNRIMSDLVRIVERKHATTV